jgi:hypothetical protein
MLMNKTPSTPSTAPSTSPSNLGKSPSGFTILPDDNLSPRMRRFIEAVRRGGLADAQAKAQAQQAAQNQ